jgi:hypothetical protein
MTDGDPSTWVTVRDVAEDGSRVTIEVHHGARFNITRRPQVWDARTGEDRTPGVWADAEREQLLAARNWRDSGLSNLLSHAAGREFLSDEAAWAALRERFAAGRGMAIDDVRRTVRPVGADEQSDLFPASLQFSPDGRLVSYVSRHGWPVHLVSDSLGDGTTVEDARTGRKVAFLPGVTDQACLTTGGRVAVSRLHPKDREGEQPRLALWDLATSAVRAELVVADDAHVSFSPDGRYVFARWSDWGKSGMHYLRWWEADTGRRVGQVDNAWDTAFLAGGRVLVTKPLPPKRAGVSEAYRLYFWDVATGGALQEWDLGAPADGGGLFNDLTGSGSDRYLTAVFHPDYGRGRDLAGRVADRLARTLAAGPPPDRMRVVVWDTTERREVARVPGRAAALSADGRWVATVDGAGVIRVWEVPPGLPWARILGYAGAAAVGTAAGLIFGRRRVRRYWGHLRTGWLGRGAHWLWRDRRRRLSVAAVAGCGAAAAVALVWYSLAAARARADMLAVFEEVNATPGLTEADVTALAGRPPKPGPVAEIAGPKKGGGQDGIPVTLRKWTRFGTEMDVFFGDDGKVRSVWVSDPPTVGERIAMWLGI